MAARVPVATLLLRGCVVSGGLSWASTLSSPDPFLVPPVDPLRTPISAVLGRGIVWGGADTGMGCGSGRGRRFATRAAASEPALVLLWSPCLSWSPWGCHARCARPAVLAVLTLLLCSCCGALLVPCVVLAEDAHHLFGEIPHRG